MLRFVAVPTSLDKALDGRGPQKNKHHKVPFQVTFKAKRFCIGFYLSYLSTERIFIEERKAKYPASDYCLQYGFSSLDSKQRESKRSHTKVVFGLYILM
jgi:hypothetical protein